MSVVQGSVAPGFDAVREEFERQFTAGDHAGAGLAAYRGCEIVVDLWGGVADEAAGTRWQRDTMTVCYSTTKGLTAACVHLLADRGLLAYDDPVARYWPEFAANGKERITIYQVLTHQAGLSRVPASIDEDTVLDRDLIAQACADEEPAWAPGEATGYHALTFGWLAGEIVRRVDGRSVGAVLREEICAPLGIADEMYLGAPADVEDRIAPLYHPVPATDEAQSRAQFFQSDSLVARSLSPGFDLYQVLNSPQGHRAEIPSVGMVATARAIARFYACLANNGQLDGARILGEATVRAMSLQQTERPDLVLTVPVGWALGYMTGGGAVASMGPRRTSFGHPGYGGSIGFAEPDTGMSFGFVPNRLTRDFFGGNRAAMLAGAVRGCVEQSAGGAS